MPMNETLRSDLNPHPETIALLRIAARVMQRNGITPAHIGKA